MASIAQLVSEFAHSLGQPNNQALRNNIKSLIIHTRAEVIRRSYENHNYIDKGLTQRYRVSLISVNDGDIELPDGVSVDKIKRTKQKVQRPVRLTNNLPFDRVSTVGYKTNREIPFIKETVARFRGSLPGMCGAISYDYINDYIYINVINENALQDIDSIVIEAPFEKPEIVEMETSTDGTYTIDDDYEYFLPEDMIDNVKKLVLATFNPNIVRDDDKIPTPNLVK